MKFSVHATPIPSLLIATLLSLTACSQGAQSVEDYEPEAATGYGEQQLARSDDYMISAANSHAVDAGLAVLEAGGSAMDAAIAVQAMLTLVEPQSSGIGGGAFIMYWEADTETLHTLDARETAPAKVDKRLFLDQEGEPARWIDAVVGGRSVGTPGLVKGLEAGHQRFGVLDWADLFDATIEKAEQGFAVSPRLSQLVRMEMNPGLSKMPAARDYFFPDGEAIEAGDTLYNPELAESLRLIAKEGAAGFYQGALAEKMVQAVQSAAIEPGYLSLDDLADYRVQWRDPVCGLYRAQQICSMGPPSSGGITLLQTLGMLEAFDLSAYEATDSTPWHYFTQASRLAFADRDTYIADSDFVDVPVAAMLDPQYLASRAALINESDMGQASAGELATTQDYAMAIDAEQPSTTHISIVDGRGNAVSMTSTIEMGFGSTVMAGGFLLNNQLTDFARDPYAEEGLVANRVEPGKRPRSSMTPVMTFNADGELVHVVGSPGGPRIINYVGKTLIGLLDFNLDMQAAIELPNVTNMNGGTAIEADLSPAHWPEDFEGRGHSLDIRALNSGIHGISRVDGGLLGGADPRREGVARGQ